MFNIEKDLTKWINKNSHYLKNYANRLNPVYSDDLVQESYLIALTYGQKQWIDSFTFNRFMKKMIRFALYKHIKEYNLVPDLYINQKADKPILTNYEEKDYYRRFLNNLKEEDRSIMEEWSNGFTLKEISDDRNINKRMVKYKIKKILSNAN